MKKTLAILLAAVLVMMMAGAHAGSAPTQSVLDKVLEKGKITIAVFSDVPPLGYMDEKNELVGLDVDVAKGIAEALDVEVEFVPTTNANRIPYLVSGKVDLVVASFTMNSERRKAVEYTDQYFRGGAILVVNSENEKMAGIESIEDMSGMKIAVSKGSFNDELATELAGATNEIIRFDNVSDLYQSLKEGKADAVVEDVVLAGYTIKNQYPELKTVGDLLSIDVWGMGVNRGDQIFLNWLNGYIYDMCSSGKMAEICAKYGVDYNPVNYTY